MYEIGGASPAYRTHAPMRKTPSDVAPFVTDARKGANQLFPGARGYSTKNGCRKRTSMNRKRKSLQSGACGGVCTCITVSTCLTCRGGFCVMSWA